MPQDCEDSLEEDLHIQAQTPVIDVAHVQADHFVEVLDVRPSAYLPHAGDAVAHGKAILLVYPRDSSAVFCSSSFATNVFFSTFLFYTERMQSSL